MSGDVRRFEHELLEEFRSRYRDLLDQIRNEKTLPDEDKLKEAINSLKQRFQPSEQTEQEREEEYLDEQTAAGAEAEAERKETSS